MENPIFRLRRALPLIVIVLAPGSSALAQSLDGPIYVEGHAGFEWFTSRFEKALLKKHVPAHFTDDKTVAHFVLHYEVDQVCARVERVGPMEVTCVEPSADFGMKEVSLIDSSQRVVWSYNSANRHRFGPWWIEPEETAKSLRGFLEKK